MDEQNIPIDINTNKLLDWLISRRHINKDWQTNVIKIREKINNAIQDMPAHEGIIKLLSGQHINYFHCLKIIEILKETEADTKNLFGRYGSQRMKDWQEIINYYQRDNLYLAEAAQMLIRNVSYEVPSLKKQLSKLEQTQVECEKKIKDYTKSETLALNEFNTSCKQLRISGNKIKSELIHLLDELPEIYEKITKQMDTIKPAVDYYSAFQKFLSGKQLDVDTLSLLMYLINNGNTTTYEYVYGEKPVTVELPQINIIEDEKDNNFDDNQIDFNYDSIDTSAIDFGDTVLDQGDIDWGNLNTDEGFEIVDHIDLDVNLEETGIVVEKSGIDGGVARGVEAFTILDNPKTRDQILNELMELEAFLKMRTYELNTESNDLLSMSQMQDAPTILQMQTVETVTMMNAAVCSVLNELTSKRIHHLHNIKHSAKYIDILTATLKQKLAVVDRMVASKNVLQDKIKEVREEGRKIAPTVDIIIKNTKILQSQIEDDISKKYKGRPVNIVGGVNMM